VSKLESEILLSLEYSVDETIWHMEG